MGSRRPGEAVRKHETRICESANQKMRVAHPVFEQPEYVLNSPPSRCYRVRRPAQPHQLDIVSSLTVQAAARLNPIQVAVDIYLQ